MTQDQYNEAAFQYCNENAQKLTLAEWEEALKDTTLSGKATELYTECINHIDKEIEELLKQKKELEDDANGIGSDFFYESLRDDCRFHLECEGNTFITFQNTIYEYMKEIGK